MGLRVIPFEEDTDGLRSLSSIVEDGDNGVVIAGPFEGDVYDRTIDALKDYSGIDMEVVHDSVSWQWVGVVVY